MRPRSANLKTVGWLAQWEEMLQDAEQKIARPRQIYLYRLRCAEFCSVRKARANDTHEPVSGTRFRRDSCRGNLVAAASQEPHRGVNKVRSTCIRSQVLRRHSVC